MEDEKIIELYWSRDENAIPATAEKYGRYCAAVAGKLLALREDAEECVNDTYLAAWNAMPPHRPAVLPAFLGKLTRNLALNRLKREGAAKRGGREVPLVLEELGDCVSGRDDTHKELERRELARAIDGFLSALPREKRQLFLCRYWYADSVGEIAGRFAMSENRVCVTLHRLRKQLDVYLKERGFSL